MATKKTVMLTTTDNPYDPFSQFDDWYRYDVVEGRHNCCSYLARIAKTSEALSDAEIEAETERAIDEIVFNDPFDLYRKVSQQTFESD